MTWSFETDPGFQTELDWIDTFTREEIEPFDLVFRSPGDPWEPGSPAAQSIAPLKDIVKERRLWACHLGSELGAAGYSQVKLGLMNEILGRSRFGPSVFGFQAPDSGNAEILAHFGIPEQRARYLQPLPDGNIASCYSMTEHQAGSDPAEFTCTAVRDGDDWNEFTPRLSLRYQFSDDVMAYATSIRSAYHFLGEHEVNVTSSPELKNDDQHLLDASINYQVNNVRVSLFGRNLTDEDGYTHGYDVAGLCSYASTRPPRTWGMELVYDFGD